MSCQKIVPFASLAAFLIGCGSVNDGSASNPVTAPATEPLTQTCNGTSPGNGFVTGTLPSQAGPFTLEFDASASAANEDALFGLSHGTPATYADLAAILRFNPSGRLDVRNGSSYAADFGIEYSPAVRRQYRLTVDPAAHRYSASRVSPEGVTTFAHDFAFRTEQSETSTLDSYGMVADAGGSFSVCNVNVGDPCQSAGRAFSNKIFAQQGLAFTASFSVTPSANGIDGVIGMSRLGATKFSELATAVRFNPDGFIDVRNGSAYGADVSYAYSAGNRYDVMLIVDVWGKRYSVLVGGKLIARNYSFRTEELAAAALQNWSYIADSDTGSFTVCDFSVAESARTIYLRDREAYAPYTFNALAPVSTGTILAASDNVTLEIDGWGNVVHSDPHGGANLATDANDNRFYFGQFSGTYAPDPNVAPLASAGGTDVYVAAFYATRDGTPATLRYDRRFGGAGDDVLGAYDVNAHGDAVINVGTALFHLDSVGDDVWYRQVGSGKNAVALDRNDNAFVGEALSTGSGFTLTKVDPTNTALWQVTGTFTNGGGLLMVLKATPDGGVILAGPINGTLTLGSAAPFTAYGPSDVAETFVAKLDAAGNPVFETAVDINSELELGVDGSGRVSVTGVRFNPERFFLEQLAADGSLIAELGGHELTMGIKWGTSGPLAVDAFGRVYWSFSPSFENTSLGYLARIEPLQ